MELTRGSLADCIGKLVNNEASSDVVIVFKDSDVKCYAHKLILSSRSDVFHTMFYGAVNEVTTNSHVFEIADIEPETFLELLTFMYTDRINLNEDNFPDIIYSSHKYNIQFLDSVCADFLNKRLDINNVCSFLNQCFVYNNAVTEECLMFIDWAIDDLIKLKKLDDLNDEALILVTERDTLIVKELDLFKFMIKRADKLSMTKETMSKRIFEKLRFPTMSVEDFSECYRLRPELFTSEQISSIFKCCSSAVRDDNLLYPTTKRAYNTKFNNDIINAIELEGTKISSQKAHELKFRVKQPMALCQIDFSARCVNMKICALDGVGKSRTLHEHNSRSNSFFNTYNDTVTFPSNIILLPNIRYVVETRSDCGNKMICQGVSKGSIFKNLFDFSYCETVVKKISFKLNSRKRKLEIE